MTEDPTTRQDHTHPDPAAARADLDATKEALTASAKANTLPLAAGLLASGAAMTAASLTVAADAEFDGSSMFIVRILLSLALLVPGAVIYSAARSWKRGDTVLLAVTLFLQVGCYIGGAVASNVLGEAMYADLAAAVIILVTTAVMLILRRRV
ncbi:hypothetical protein [Brevibacterium luteolum]|uniref:hypothetical protein n=1 Tax=Brevibacterium luteolum TaxID=199591 RepID=UPI001C230A1A|nr:hypothetical protein [Brevibacterium luteolum]MBU8579131.1 hypothetical protein [Brevibacterium luteolum]